MPQNSFNYKGKKSNFTMAKPGRYHLNWVIKVKSMSNGTNWNCVPSDRTPWEECRSTSVMFLPKIHNLNLIMRKYRTNLNGGTFCKITCLWSSNVSRSYKSKKDWGNVSNQRRLKTHDSQMQDVVWTLDSFCFQECYWDRLKLEWGLNWDGNNVSVCISQFWRLHCGYI